MMGFLQRVFRKGAATPIPYEESKRLSQGGSIKDRRRVATHTGLRPELLYFLAQDPDPGVRAAVAANAATPVQADLLLARDGDDSVRQDLARKIALLAPGLTAQEHDRLRRMTYEVLEILVRDQVARVRQIVAEALKDVADAPPEIIQRLARDCEIVVAGPVLQFSPLLSESDLLEIIGGTPIAGAREAVARRKGISEPVSEVIGTSNDMAAIAALLDNPSAQVREELLDRLVERAPTAVAWHRPLVQRPRLSGGAARRLARFVAVNLLAILRDRRDFDAETTRDVAATVMRRLDEEGEGGGELAGASDPAAADMARARSLHAAGKLDDATVAAAVGSERGFAKAALAVLAKLPLDEVEKVLAAHSAKGVVALAWHAGLSMRTAIVLQTALAHIAPQTVLRARADGSYPLTPEAMRWQLDFLIGISASRPAR
jgi:uncharacterized protein (DUF2336 family)